ncbi:MAG: aspartate ammonia-lyase [Alphaproteobacteria bacterium]|nr:aspartate ammonia-lyase [Alphaproteobacteria bacterium]
MSQNNFRCETDFLGVADVPVDALYGIHTVRALANFPLSLRRVPPALIHAFGFVKLAAIQTNRSLGFWKDDDIKVQAMESACAEMSRGLLDAHIVVDALQGGAGTSTNMNVNEVLANRALQLCGEPLGAYKRISPLDDLNLHQSTNDAYPTALKLAAIHRIRLLEERLASLVEAFQRKEQALASIPKIGRTQLQEAVPLTLGREMAAYAAAFGRDRWRLSKCEERLRVVNLGGTAIGTGLTAPRAYIFRAVETLRDLTGIGFARAEDMVENTQNADVFVEVSGLLRTCATNFIKCASDLRLLSSGPNAGIGEIILPALQAGSSIMPGKVNPVIPEAVTQAALCVYGYDLQIATAAGMGNLELNAFLPLIADSLLNGIDLLANAAEILQMRCVEGLSANEEKCRASLDGATSLATALVAELGHEKAVHIAQRAHAEGKTIRQIVLEEKLMSEDDFEKQIASESFLRLGTP